MATKKAMSEPRKKYLDGIARAKCPCCQSAWFECACPAMFCTTGKCVNHCPCPRCTSARALKEKTGDL